MFQYISLVYFFAVILRLELRIVEFGGIYTIKSHKLVEQHMSIKQYLSDSELILQ